MVEFVGRLFFGKPIPTAIEEHLRLSKLKALAIFSSDALSSVAYATEEIMLVLVVAGSAALGASIPIALFIASLIVIVSVSYLQTIHGYPSGGGAYVVAHDNLGVWPGLSAAAALLVDYVLTVAVSITAGMAAISSAFPVLLPFRVELAVGAVVFIAWANLRGVRESGTLFAVPTYAFIFLVFTLICTGFVQMASGTLLPSASQTSLPDGSILQRLTALLLLRAFASGCTALTGIEAISNGIPAFRKPEADNAGKTLIAMVVLLAVMFLGITILTRAIGAVPIEHETILSQIGRTVLGPGPLYLALQGATSLILIVAANTAFADFPRLSSILAGDRYLPHQLANLGDRLVFQNGIILLAIMASILIIVAGGETHRLIPLYAVGVFLAFTLSQAGMVRHWYRQRSHRWEWKAALNGLGAMVTSIVLMVITAGKFLQGAWISIALMAICVWLFSSVKRHYQEVAAQLSLDGLNKEEWTDAASQQRYKVVVPVSGIHRGTVNALRFARSLSTNVTAVIVDVDSRVTDSVRDKWPAWGRDIPLLILESPFRSTIGPLLSYLDSIDQWKPELGLAVVVLPEFVPARWWHRILHNGTAQLIKRVLLYQRGRAAKDRVIIDVPYHLRR
jgi:amino acid transporter